VSAAHHDGPPLIAAFFKGLEEVASGHPQSPVVSPVVKRSLEAEEGASGGGRRNAKQLLAS